LSQGNQSYHVELSHLILTGQIRC